MSDAESQSDQHDQVRQTPFGWWSRLRRRWWVRWSIDLLLIAGLVFAVSTWQASCGESVGDEIASIRVERVDGSSTELVEPGERTLLYLWAPWCGVCEATGANVARVARWSGVDVRAVAFDWKSRGRVVEKARAEGLESYAILGDETTRRRLEPSSYPTFVVVGADGQIRYRWVGYTTTLGMLLRAWL